VLAKDVHSAPEMDFSIGLISGARPGGGRATPIVKHH